jgi:hypothetical protein
MRLLKAFIEIINCIYPVHVQDKPLFIVCERSLKYNMKYATFQSFHMDAQLYFSSNYVYVIAFRALTVQIMFI